MRCYDTGFRSWVQHSCKKPFSLGTLARKVRDTLGRAETVQ